jgi:hypothetical protein
VLPYIHHLFLITALRIVAPDETIGPGAPAIPGTAPAAAVLCVETIAPRYCGTADLLPGSPIIVADAGAELASNKDCKPGQRGPCARDSRICKKKPRKTGDKSSRRRNKRARDGACEPVPESTKTTEAGVAWSTAAA